MRVLGLFTRCELWSPRSGRIDNVTPSSAGVEELLSNGRKPTASLLVHAGSLQSKFSQTTEDVRIEMSS